MRRVKRWLYLFLITCVDWAAIIYFYIIVSSLLSLAVFVPFLPGIFIYSLAYYVFCLWKWGKTLGMFIFSAIYQSPHKICVIANVADLRGEKLHYSRKEFCDCWQSSRKEGKTQELF